MSITSVELVSTHKSLEPTLSRLPRQKGHDWDRKLLFEHIFTYQSALNAWNPRNSKKLDNESGDCDMCLPIVEAAVAHGVATIGEYQLGARFHAYPALFISFDVRVTRWIPLLFYCFCTQSFGELSSSIIVLHKLIDKPFKLLQWRIHNSCQNFKVKKLTW